MLKRLLFAGLLAMMSMSLSGCELLGLPFHIVGGIFNFLGKAVAVANSLPKPPPGVFF
ncbi:MAG: hypothetical protein HY591_02325 [Candidatus Omnitrophica bacterium]|nr:hypothetical protein [Candidatus Omnitrophota bacterium]